MSTTGAGTPLTAREQVLAKYPNAVIKVQHIYRVYTDVLGNDELTYEDNDNETIEDAWEDALETIKQVEEDEDVEFS